MPYASEKRQAITAIFIVFLFIFSEVLIAENDVKHELDNKSEVSYSIYEYSALTETHIQSGNSNTNYLSSTDTIIGVNDISGDESRGLYRFANNLSNSVDSILDAQLTLTCNVNSVSNPGTQPMLYGATIIANFAPSEVSWNDIADSINWQTPGINGNNDRSVWDVPSSSTVVSGTIMEYNLNVTKLAQTSLELGRNKFDFVLSSVGGEMSCYKNGNGNANYEPSLTITNFQGVHGDGGSVTANFLENGMPLMTEDFIPAPDSHPVISYESLVGTGVQFQFSTSNDYRNHLDQDWIYSTMGNTFTTTANSGEYDIPASESFTIGDTIYYRYRSIDNTSKLSDWNTGFFLLPGYTITNNNDGTATLNLDNDDFNLQGYKLIEDTYVDSSNNVAQGGQSTLKVSFGPAEKSVVHVAVNLHLLGLPENASIQSASIDLERDTVTTAAPMLSMHQYTGNSWSEDEATRNYGKIGNSWNNGGLSDIDSSEDTSINPNQLSGDFSINVQNSIQQNLASTTSESLAYVLTGFLPTQQNPSQLESVTFASSEYDTTSGSLSKPSLAITYSWSSNSSVSESKLIEPINGQAAWNESNGNLSGNTMPTLIWETTDNTLQNSIIQLSTDEFFRDLVIDYDSRSTSNSPTNSDQLDVLNSDGLTTGSVYYWRVKHVDNDGLSSDWNQTSFLVSSASSQWLGGDLHKLTINSNTEPNINGIPNFSFSTISSSSPNTNTYGYPFLSVSESTSQGKSNALLSLDVINYLLPDGLAVTGSEIKLHSLSSSSSPNIGIWGLSNHDWNEQEVTWLESSSGVQWTSAGASGSGDRISLLDSEVISSSGQYTWNITSSMQDSMRDNQRLDLMIEVLPGQSNANALFYSPVVTNPSQMPTIEITYSLGSNQKPLPPSALTPSNGEWVFVNNSSLEVNLSPTIEWTPNNIVPVIGWGLEIDTSDQFNSPNKRSVTSWNDPGFDISNNQYDLQTDLQIAQKWFWRVRGLSSTYQLGEWSSNFHFYLPDFNVDLVDSDTYTAEFYHNSAMGNSQVLEFVDTSITDSLVPSAINLNEPFLEVGTTSTNVNSSMLIKIPMPIEMHPENASVIDARLTLESTPLSATGIPVAVRSILKPWDENANSIRYNSTNNWSELGGRGISSDVSSPLDIQNSVNGEMSWDITSLVQQSLDQGQPYISVMLYASQTQPGDLVYFQSSDFSSGQPTINMTWSYGSRDLPGNQPVLISPANGQIYFNQTSHAIIPDRRPTYDWQWPASSSSLPSDWRIYFDLDPVDDMGGQLVFDSRTDPNLFDLTNLKFTPDQDIDYRNDIYWSVQAVDDSMYGEISAVSNYFIPNAMGAELTATDAILTIQDGTILEQTNFPQATADIYLDEGASSTGQDGNGLTIGNSSILANNQSTTSAIVSFNISTLPLPAVFEIISADLTLAAVSGFGSIDISASRMLTDWDESSTWDNNISNNTWINPGALRGADSELPDALLTVDATGNYTWDVTRIAQLIVESGGDEIAVLLQPEIFNTTNGALDGNYNFADSENVNKSLRPKLVIKYRTVEQWLPPSPNQVTPSNSSTLWNTSSYELVGPDSIDFSFNPLASNVSEWVICHGQEIRWLDCESSTDSNSQFSYDSSSNTFSLSDKATVNGLFGDQWQYWRLRADQDHRIGHYTELLHYRMIGTQATDDGNGNYEIDLSRSSIFSDTGDLPIVHDASTDTANPQLNSGNYPALRLGFDPISTGINEPYFSFDLSDIFFDSYATPISAIFELQLASSTQNINPIDVSVFACDQFDESLLGQVTPVCSGTELTKTTISTSNSGTVQWDITSLLQYNFNTGNDTISFVLSPQSGVTNFVDFYSSESQNSLRPKLKLTYIENIGGLTPPSQPSLVTPSNGDILYDTTGDVATAPQNIQLNWVQSPDATDYILYISNQNNVVTYDSRVDSSIQGNSFTSNQFTPGEVYEWWVQGVNQTIPGPSSQRWSFGVGNPEHYYNNDGTFAYMISDSSDVAGYSHINVRDTTITDALPLANFGFIGDLTVGSGCFSTVGSVCDTIIALDTSQIPISSDQTIHSIELTLYVDQWDFSGGAYAIDVSVHQFLINNWNEYGISWNTTGANPGPVAGVDYLSAPLDERRFFGSLPKLTFQIATESLVIGDDIHLLVRGSPLSTTTNTDGFVTLHSSEDSQQNLRPKFKLVHTNISSLNITTPSATFNADDTYTFTVDGYDYSGVAVPGGMPNGAQLEWSSTTGTIAGTGTNSATLTPTTNGVQTVTACYGVICTDYIINIESGLPVQLFASLDQSSDVDSATISADETITVSAYAIDQHGNLVTNEIISFSPSNGSIDPNGVFSPYTSGAQTVTVQWIGATSTLQEVLDVEVLPGVPVEVTISGCNEIIHADTNCDLFGSAFDQFGNTVWFDDVISYTLSATDGETTKIVTPTPHSQPPAQDVLIGEYTGNFVGQWTVSLNTDLGISDTLNVEVTHGALDSFVLTGSSATITADEVLYINATRIDVRGNELSLILPIENWTNVADGIVSPGTIATWSPNSQGTKTITASYQGLTDSVEVFVVRGVIADLQLLINDEVSNGEVLSITSDDTVSASIRALDAKGNQWLVDGEWSFFHPDFADQSVLSSNYSQEITFSPTLSSSTPYTISVEHQEGDVIKTANFVVYVSQGDIQNFLVTGIDSNGFAYSDVESFDITTDDFIDFEVSTTDTDLNIIDNPQVTWMIEDMSTGNVEDITGYMLQNGLVWDATIVGDWQISAYLINQRGFNLTAEFDIMVSHGVPVSLTLQQSVTTQDAGNFVDLQVTGTDSDGNQFPQTVVWLENNGPSYNINSTDDEGIYQFNGRSAGNYTLTAEYLTLSNSVYVEVFPLGIVKNIKSDISTVDLEQLEVITVQIDAYDLYWNKIPVPNSARIDTTDRGDVKYLGGGVWELSTLDEGEHSATIVIGSITETFTYNVEGNLAGFFAAGGPLYYVGAGLIGLIVIALLVFVIRLVRGDEDYYDDDEDDDDYYQDSSEAPVTKDFSQPRISQAPTVPTPPAQPPTSEPEPEPEVEESIEPEEEDTSWMADYRVDEDGTEWGQTEDGVWYYRDSGSDEWIEWTD